MGGLAGRRALVKVTSAPVAFADQATTDAGDHQNYQITDATKRIWDRASAPVVKVGGAVTAEVYTFNRLSGTITFATVDAARAAVTVSGNYLPTSVAIGAYQFSIEIDRTVILDIDFDSANTNNGHNTYQSGMLDLTGSLSRRVTVDTYFRDALLADTPVVIVFYNDRAGAPAYTCWALLDKVALSSAVDALQDSTIEFKGEPDDQGVAVVANVP